MNKTTLAALASCIVAAAAIAHPGGHGEDEGPMPAFDCSAMAGSYAADAKRTATVSVDHSAVTIAIGKDNVPATCVSPLLDEGALLPRALITSGEPLGPKFAKPGCCIVVLKNNGLAFDNGEVWKRK